LWRHHHHHKSIEVHIFDFDDDIYNSDITIYFVAKIRDEQKYSDINELREQLTKDRIIALDILLADGVEKIF